MMAALRLSAVVCNGARLVNMVNFKLPLRLKYVCKSLKRKTSNQAAHVPTQDF